MSVGVKFKRGGGTAKRGTRYDAGQGFYNEQSHLFERRPSISAKRKLDSQNQQPDTQNEQENESNESKRQKYDDRGGNFDKGTYAAAVNKPKNPDGNSIKTVNAIYKSKDKEIPVTGFRDKRSNQYMMRGIYIIRRNNTVMVDYMREIINKYGNGVIDMIYQVSYKRIEVIMKSRDLAIRLSQSDLIVKNNAVRVNMICPGPIKYKIKNIMPWLSDQEIIMAMAPYGTVIEGTIVTEYIEEGEIKIKTGTIELMIERKYHAIVPKQMAIKIKEDYYRWYLAPAELKCFNCGLYGHWMQYCEIDFDRERVQERYEQEKKERNPEADTQEQDITCNTQQSDTHSSQNVNLEEIEMEVQDDDNIQDNKQDEHEKTETVVCDENSDKKQVIEQKKVFDGKGVQQCLNEDRLQVFKKIEKTMFGGTENLKSSEKNAEEDVVSQTPHCIEEDHNVDQGSAVLMGMMSGNEYMRNVAGDGETMVLSEQCVVRRNLVEVPREVRTVGDILDVCEKKNEQFLDKDSNVRDLLFMEAQAENGEVDDQQGGINDLMSNGDSSSGSCSTNERFSEFDGEQLSGDDVEHESVSVDEIDVEYIEGGDGDDEKVKQDCNNTKKMHFPSISTWVDGIDGEMQSEQKQDLGDRGDDVYIGGVEGPGHGDDRRDHEFHGGDEQVDQYVSGDSAQTVGMGLLAQSKMRSVMNGTTGIIVPNNSTMVVRAEETVGEKRQGKEENVVWSEDTEDDEVGVDGKERTQEERQMSRFRRERREIVRILCEGQINRGKRHRIYPKAILQEFTKVVDEKYIEENKDYYKSRKMYGEIVNFLSHIKFFNNPTMPKPSLQKSRRRSLKLCIEKFNKTMFGVKVGKIRYSKEGKKIIPQCNSRLTKMIRTVDQAVDVKADKKKFHVEFFENMDIVELKSILSDQESLDFLNVNGRLPAVYAFWLQMAQCGKFTQYDNEFHDVILSTLKGESDNFKN